MWELDPYVRNTFECRQRRLIALCGPERESGSRVGVCTYSSSRVFMVKL